MNSMGVRLGLLLLICLPCFGCQQSIADPSQWEVYKINNFSIKFPIKPVSQTKTEKTLMGDITFTYMQAELRGKLAFFASSNGYPTGAFEDVNIMLDGAIQGALSNVNGKVVNSKDLEKNGVAGREVIIEAEKGIVIRARFFIDGSGPTLYQANVVSNSKDQINGAVATAYFDSMDFPAAGPAADQ